MKKGATDDWDRQFHQQQRQSQMLEKNCMVDIITKILDFILLNYIWNACTYLIKSEWFIYGL